MQVQKFQIRKFLLIEPHIAYPQISAKVSSPQIANSQIFHHKTERMKHLNFFPPFIAKLSDRRFVWLNFLFYKNSN